MIQLLGTVARKRGWNGHQVVQLEVVVVLAERVDQRFGDLHPSHVEGELWTRRLMNFMNFFLLT